MEHIGKEMGTEAKMKKNWPGVEGESSGLILNHDISTDKS